MKNHTPRNPVELRRQAEERLREKRVSQVSQVVGQRAAEETAQTLHELRVRQVELEIQNEELRRVQAEIDASRARYFDLYDLAPVGYCTVSEPGLILEANLAAANLLGMARGALVKQPLSHFILKEDLDDYHLHCKKLFETGEIQEFEVRLVKPDGTQFWAHLTTTVARAEDGDPLCRLVLSDVTGRKQAEADCEVLPRLLQHLNAGVVIHAADTRILFANEMASRLLGLTPDQMFGKTVIDPAWSFIREDGTPLPLAEYPVNRVLATHKPFQNQVLGVNRPATRDRSWVLVNAYPEFVDSHQLNRVVVAFIDITERKRAEDALKQSEELLSETERLGRVGGWSFNIDTMAQTWTDEVYRIHEIEISPNPTVEAGINYYTKASRPIIEKAVQRAMELGEEFDLELEIITAKGNNRSVHTIGKADLNNRRIYGFFQDITERKRAEESLRQAGEILKTMQMGLYVYELETPADDSSLRMVAANAASGTLSGVSPEELIGKYIDEIFPALRALGIPKRFADIVRTGNTSEFEDFYYADDRVLEAAYAVKAFPLPNHRVGITFDNITERKRAEQGLRESEARFRSIFTSMTEMVVLHELVCDADGRPANYRILDCNPAFTQITGIRRDDAVGRLATDVYGSDTAPYLDEFAPVALTGEPCAFITSYAPMGKHFDVHLASPGKNMFITVTTDITERKQTEDALKASEMRFKELLRNVSTVAVQSYALDGTVLYWNRASETFYGYTAEEAIGRNLLDLIIPPAMRDGVRKTICRMGDTLDAIPASELELMRKDGTMIPVYSSHALVQMPGLEPELFCIDIDLTERKRAEEVNRLLSSILKTSKDFIGIASPDGQASYVNPSGMAMVGIDSDEVLKRTSVDDYFFPEDLPFLHEVIFPTLHKEGRWAGEFRFRHFKTGEPILIHYDLFLTEDPSTGEVQNISTISRDISIRKQLEREQERILKELKVEKEAAVSANRAKDEFLAVISHEMRTPLNPILGFASLLLDDCDSEATRDALECIINAGERQLRLIDDILSYSRLDRSHIHPVHSQFSLLSSCESALQDTIPASHGLELIFKNGLPDWKPLPSDLNVKTDASMLARLLGNLLGNACKYTKQGRIVLKVGMENSSACTRRFHFRIEDTGIGISKKDADRLFEPFVQVDSSYTRSFEGAGLGLAICKKMIDLLGGDIGLESEPGKGASFWFTLPLETIVPPPMIDSGKASGAGFAAGAMNLQLLVVDDRPDNARIAVVMAEHLGNRCVSCQSGLDALRICSEQSFDAILLDLAMPGTNGFETLRLLREAPGPNRRTPVIAVTADATDTVQERCIAAGMVAYISKPIRRRKLFEVLNAIATPVQSAS